MRGAPTMLQTKVVLDDVEVLERTYVRPDKVAAGSGPKVLAQQPHAGLAPQPDVLPAPTPALTPVLEREVFQLIRRVALQADLASAVLLQRQGLARLVAAPAAGCRVPDPSAPLAPQPPPGASAHEQAKHVIAHVATTGQRIVLSHAIVEPVGPAPTRAVLVLRRTPAAPPFGGFELGVAAAIARGVAGVLAHFQTDHAAKQEQAARDAKTPFRAEVLAEKRRAAVAPGRVVATPRTWIRWAFPTLLVLVAGVITAAALVQVPTYSTGAAIVMVDGELVTASQPGTVAELLVAPYTRVAAGDPLVRMHGQQRKPTSPRPSPTTATRSRRS